MNGNSVYGALGRRDFSESTAHAAVYEPFIELFGQDFVVDELKRDHMARISYAEFSADGGRVKARFHLQHIGDIVPTMYVGIDSDDPDMVPEITSVLGRHGYSIERDPRMVPVQATGECVYTIDPDAALIEGAIERMRREAAETQKALWAQKPVDVQAA